MLAALLREILLLILGFSVVCGSVVRILRLDQGLVTADL
ncbi:hypothetical protein V441_11910 [Pseudomonas aeruginosa DHS29]|nr:hypothetical protein V441_11910 [Pseudomonas aeruginosa DHS29]